jgi:hypothetical protein
VSWPRYREIVAVRLVSPVTIDGMSAVIWVVLVLLAIGIVVESLIRLRKWLNSAPPLPRPEEPPEADI